MSFPRFEKELDKITKKIKNDYLKDLSSRQYRIADNVVFETKVFGSVYLVTVNLPDYWQYIENGRRPGKFPPMNKIINWVKYKNIIPNPGTTVNQLAFLIGRKIAKFGIEPKHLLSNAYKKQLPNISKLVTEFQLDIIVGINNEIKIKK